MPIVIALIVILAVTAAIISVLALRRIRLRAGTESEVLRRLAKGQVESLRSKCRDQERLAKICSCSLMPAEHHSLFSSSAELRQERKCKRIRVNAIKTISLLEHQASFPALLGATADYDEDVGKAAQQTMKKFPISRDERVAVCAELLLADNTSTLSDEGQDLTTQLFGAYVENTKALLNLSYNAPFTFGWKIQEAAARTLAGLGGDKAAEALHAALRKSTAVEVVAPALAKLKVKAAIPDLQKEADGTIMQEGRQACLRALKSLGAKQASRLEISSTLCDHCSSSIELRANAFALVHSDNPTIFDSIVCKKCYMSLHDKNPGGWVNPSAANEMALSYLADEGRLEE